MTARTPSSPRLLDRVDAHPSIWLLLGAALLVASQMRFGIGLLAWIAPLPWLRHLRVTTGGRARLALALTSLVAWTLATLKIVTDPMPAALAVLFALPIALALTVPYLLVPTLRRRLGDGWAVAGFAALMVAGEWVLHAALPFGTWGSAADTQLDQLGLMQLASVTGLHGVSFLVYLVGATLEALAAAPTRARARALAAVVAMALAIGAAGEARLAWSTARGLETVRVAAVGTDSTIGAGPIPTDAQIAAVDAGLFARTRAAARAGASIVVWTEAATLVRADEEAAFHRRVGALARELETTVVAAYIVPLSFEPLRYRNRYALFGPDGALEHTYDKHHPVPGEPSEPGTAPMPLFVTPELGRVSGAICYDYDFPRLGLAHARLGLDLVALPSSDWRGIDPIHTEMAAVRAIEGGHSLVRSTRFGLSAAYDPYGRARGWLSHWDEGDRVLVARVPRHGVRTIYGALGDWFPIGCIAFGLLAVGASFGRGSRWYAARPWRTPSSPSRAEPSSTHASVSGSTSTRS